MTTTPHKHAEVIKAWADGATVQMKCGDEWQDLRSLTPLWRKEFEYRIKPAEPVRKYPVTMLSPEELSAHARDYEMKWQLEAVANLALRHAIDSGQVITLEEYKRAFCNRVVRDMAIAEAINFAVSKAGFAFSSSTLEQIVSEVKP